MRKILFINSTKSGKTEFNIDKKEIIEIYSKANRLDELEIVDTRYKNHAKEIASEFINKDYEEKIIIVCGGDGTLNEVVNVVYGSDVAIGLIPTGTGNDFSKNFDYRNFNIKDTLDMDIRKIDAIRINDSICINVMSLGFDTFILSKAYEYLDNNPNLGKKAYIRAVLSSLNKIRYEDLKLNLLLDNDEKIYLSDHYLVSALCNGAYYGSGFNPAPCAKIDDGVLNLIMAREIPFIKILPLIVDYKNGNHHKSGYIEEYRVKSGTISSKNELLANMDGEIFKSRKIEFEVLKDAINWASPSLNGLQLSKEGCNL